MPHYVNVWYSDNVYDIGGLEGSFSIFSNLGGTGKYRYTESLLIPNEYIYVCGILKTLHEINPEIKKREEEVFELIKEWKKDYPSLLEKCNITATANGEIDFQDWDKVVKAAEQQVKDKYLDSSAEEREVAINLISKHGLQPNELFIISTKRKKDLLRKLYLKFLYYIGFFLLLVVPSFSVGTWYANFLR